MNVPAVHPGAWAARTPDKPAVLMAETGEVLTYAELEDRSVRLAHVLHDAGLRPGDTLALLAENSPIYAVSHWAALRSGLYLTALNIHLSLDEQRYILLDCDARALVTTSAEGERAVALVAEAPAVELRLASTRPGESQVDGFADLDAALAAADATPDEHQPAGSDMLYSSGTTGFPKAVRAPLPDRQVTDPGEVMIGVFGPMYGFDQNTVYLSPAPLYHAAPLRFTMIVAATGGTVVVMSAFDAERALALIEQHRVTHSQWVPTMFVRMLKLPEAARTAHDVSSMQVAIHAAAPCPVEVKQQMMAWWGPILHEYYAATEAAGVTLIGPQEWLERPGSVGRAGLGVLHVVDPDSPDQPELETGQDGLVYFEREAMPFAYHHDPDKTRAAQHPLHENWATTGDLGHVDDDGFLYLTDRAAFMIISGGANVYPQEVESVLTLHPAVYDVAVIGVPDADMGEVVRAVVVASEDAVAGPDLERDLIDYVRARIAHVKAPRTVDFVTSLPRTPTGKLLKRRLIEQHG